MQETKKSVGEQQPQIPSSQAASTTTPQTPAPSMPPSGQGQAKKGLGRIILILVILLLVFTATTMSRSTDQANQTKQKSVVVTPTKVVEQYNYKVTTKTEHENRIGKFENLSVLIDPVDDPKAEAIANYIVKNECVAKCNIELYDDKTALNLQKDYEENFTKWTEQEQYIWDKEHYVFVADHYVGFVDGIDEKAGGYDSYPFRDKDYQTLKAGGSLPTPKPTLTVQ